VLCKFIFVGALLFSGVWEEIVFAQEVETEVKIDDLEEAGEELIAYGNKQRGANILYGISAGLGLASIPLTLYGSSLALPATVGYSLTWFAGFVVDRSSQHHLRRAGYYLEDASRFSIKWRREKSYKESKNTNQTIREVEVTKSEDDAETTNRRSEIVEGFRTEIRYIQDSFFDDCDDGLEDHVTCEELEDLFERVSFLVEDLYRNNKTPRNLISRCESLDKELSSYLNDYRITSSTKDMVERTNELLDSIPNFIRG